LFIALAPDSLIVKSLTKLLDRAIHDSYEVNADIYSRRNRIEEVMLFVISSFFSFV
jgi:hypothetical protein